MLNVGQINEHNVRVSTHCTRFGSLSVTPLQLKLARTALGISIRELAGIADVAPSTIVRLETSGGSTQRRTIDHLRQILEQRGVMFVDAEPGGSATIRLKE
jgi:DNA-binding XRE family transcriptional regulator